MTSCYIPQLSFSFYRHQPIRVDFSGGQITSDAGLLPLRAFDHQHGLTRGLAQRVCDPREEERVRHSDFRERLPRESEPSAVRPYRPSWPVRNFMKWRSRRS
jgi:hypothetical protein